MEDIYRMRRLIDLTLALLVFRKLSGLLARGMATAGSGVRGFGSLCAGRLRGLSAFQRHLLINLVIGLLIAVALHLMHNTSVVRTTEDAAVDWVLGIYRGTAPARVPRPIAYIDIDEATYRNWGEPLFTPRDRLAALIRHALEGGAAAIVIDIDLSRAGGAGDPALIDLLSRWLPKLGGDNAETGENGPPPLILVRTFRPPLPGAPKSLPEERASFLDPLLAHARGIYWGAPLFELDSDGKVRRWHLWKAACAGNGEPRVVPSVQLLTKALLSADAAQRAQLAEALAVLTPEDCATTADDRRRGEQDPAAKHGQVMLGEDAVSLLPDDATRRILYRIPWHGPDGEGPALVDSDVLKTRPANKVLAAADAASAGKWLRDRLVIIGSSYADSRDLYRTPLGEMPGSLLVANAVLSLGAHGTLRTPGLLETLLLEAVLITMMSWLFARFDSFWGSLFSGAAVIGLLLPLSLWLFDSGYWISFAVPLLAVQFHEVVAALEEGLGSSQAGGERHG